MNRNPQTSPAKPAYEYPRDTTMVEPASTAASEVHCALSEARDLAQYVRNIVGRMCGQFPEAESGGKDPHSDGFFPNLRFTALETTYQIRAAHAELNRLEREIP